MIEILAVSAGSTRGAERVVRDREGRRVGTARERGDDVYLDLAADAPRTVRRVLDTESADGGSERVPLEPRFVDETRDGEIRLRI
jgi:hypothetical protein